MFFQLSPNGGGEPPPLEFAPGFDPSGEPDFGTGTVEQAQGVALPDIGVDIGAAVETGVGSLGAIVLVAVGGYAAFLVVRRGLYWLRYALAYIG